MKTKKKLTPAQKRVLIAKDVIAQLKTGWLVAKPGTYVNEIARGDGFCQTFRQSDVDKGADVRDVLNVRVKRCEVCAIGAVMIAGFMRFDKVPVEQDMVGIWGRSLDCIASSQDFPSPFGKSIQDKMEDAFEYDMESEYPNPRSRLIAMMKNVIANKGAFKQ